MEGGVKLTDLLARELGFRGEVQMRAVRGGQSNPTWYLDVAGQRLVLRQQPAGELLPSAHALDREFRILQALANSTIPVPRALYYCDDRSIVGTPFYIMERVDGRVFPTAALEGANAQERRAMYRSAAQTLAHLHDVDWNTAGLASYGKHGDYFARQVARWSRQWDASRQRDIPELDQLMEWLPEHLPAERETTICHGDYRFGNLMFHPSSSQVAAVLDWELSTLGDPLADVGFFCMLYYADAALGGIANLDARALGIPSQEEFVADYCAAAGKERKLLPFHIAFAFFRFAVIFAGIEDRARRGNAADPEIAVHSGATAVTLASLACKVVGI